MPALTLGHAESIEVGRRWRANTCKMNFRIRYQDETGKWLESVPYLSAWSDAEKCTLISCHLDALGGAAGIITAYELAASQFGNPKMVLVKQPNGRDSISDYFKANGVTRYWDRPWGWHREAMNHLLQLIANWFSQHYAAFRYDASGKFYATNELPTIEEVVVRFDGWLKARVKIGCTQTA